MTNKLQKNEQNTHNLKKTQIKELDIFQHTEKLLLTENYVKIPFPNLDYNQEKHPYCGLSLKSAGSMRFRNEETNQNRIDFFTSLGIDIKRIRQPELIHSKEVFSCYFDENQLPVYESFLEGKIQTEKVFGDGIITTEKFFVPVITVADCVPLWLYDPISTVFGVVHSGWKGTGIIENALDFAQKKYGANIKDFRIIIGPHIHNCCYKVDQERENHFNTNFAKDSSTNGMLSLKKANLYLLEKLGVKPENILTSKNCTNCDTRLGSFRRETDATIEKPFTVMSAFIGHF